MRARARSKAGRGKARRVGDGGMRWGCAGGGLGDKVTGVMKLVANWFDSGFLAGRWCCDGGRAALRSQSCCRKRSGV